MRVRGYWPLRGDRAIDLPIPWVDWLESSGDGDGDNGDGDNGNGGRGGGRGAQGRRGAQGARGRGRGGSNNETGSRLLRSHGPVPGPSEREVFIPMNPFTNPASLQALKQTFAQQPNWRAAVMEGSTWDGNADENAAKWRKLNRIQDA